MLTAENFIMIIKFLKFIIINSALLKLENIIINIKIGGGFGAVVASLLGSLPETVGSKPTPLTKLITTATPVESA